jgi:hypothetical protein
MSIVKHAEILITQPTSLVSLLPGMLENYFRNVPL